MEVKGPQVGSRGENAIELLGEPAFLPFPSSSLLQAAGWEACLLLLALDLVQKRTSICPSIEWGHEGISFWGQWEGSVKCRLWWGGLHTQQIDLLPLCCCGY